MKMGPQKIIGLIIGYGGLLLAVIFLFIDFIMSFFILVGMFLLGNMIKGSQHSTLYILTGYFNKPHYNITGFVKQGYEEVYREFEHNFDIGMEQGCQLVIYVKGEKVVDLCGKLDQIKNYNKNTIQNIFSSTKVITSIVVSMLVDRGYLKYEDLVCKHWPEFSNNNKYKRALKIEDILRHEGGLSHFRITKSQISREKIRQNEIGRVIEKMNPWWNLFTPRTYHAISRGFILNEIVRRVDPQNRTIGEFVEQEITKPLDVDFFIGVPDHQLDNIHKISNTMHSNIVWYLIQGLVPTFLGGKMALNFIEASVFSVVVAVTKKVERLLETGCRFVQQGEIPSANGHSNANGMAKIASVMAMKGQGFGVKLIEKSTYNNALSEPKLARDSWIAYKKTKFVKGGWNIYDNDTTYCTQYDSSGFIGWQGYGGSIMQWHEEYEIGFGYVMNLLDCDLSNQRGCRLKAAVIRSVENLKRNQ